MEDETKTRNTNGLTVFLVDDDPDDRELFSEAMVEIGGHIALRTFSDGNSLLQDLHLSTALPDIIFLDLYMPKMEGAECLTKIRSDKRFDPIGIVIYSSLISRQSYNRIDRGRSTHAPWSPAWATGLCSVPPSSFRLAVRNPRQHPRER